MLSRVLEAAAPRARYLRAASKVVIPWIEEKTAFTAPGRHIFVARNLFQLCDNDETFAMLVAHEMAHHDLGHVEVFPDWIGEVDSSALRLIVYALYRVVETRIHGPEKECDADRYGLELCLKAGYDGRKCIALFKKLQKLALDQGDVVTAYGADIEEDQDQIEEPLSWADQVRLWLHQRKQGYLSIRERYDLLAARLQELEGCSEVA